MSVYLVNTVVERAVMRIIHLRKQGDTGKCIKHGVLNLQYCSNCLMPLNNADGRLRAYPNNEGTDYPASILRKSTSSRHRPVSYPDGPMTARYRFT